MIILLLFKKIIKNFQKNFFTSLFLLNRQCSYPAISSIPVKFFNNYIVLFF